MTTINNYNLYEPVSPDRTRYVHVETGSTISRRQYNNLKSSGAIPYHPNGATQTTQRIINFSQSNTSHRIVSVEPANLTSLWRVATANSSPTLPANISVSFRAIGDLIFTAEPPNVGGIRQPIALQTSFWSTRAEAWREWIRLLQKMRSQQFYMGSVAFAVTELQVVFRTG